MWPKAWRHQGQKYFNVLFVQGCSWCQFLILQQTDISHDIVLSGANVGWNLNPIEHIWDDLVKVAAPHHLA